MNANTINYWTPRSRTTRAMPAWVTYGIKNTDNRDPDTTRDYGSSPNDNLDDAPKESTPKKRKAPRPRL
jgi:hypothetical protein